MMATQDFSGLLFGGGGTGLEDYLSAGQQESIKNQAMLQAAAALLQAGGPSRTPISLGQALGGALQAGSQGYQQAQQGAIQNLMTGQKLQEAKRAMDLQRLTAQTLLGGEAPPEGTKPEDIKFNQYMKLADIYAASGKGEEAKRYQDMAYQIKPRSEVTGSPFEVTDTTGKPLLVQQMKDGTIRTVEGFGPKRDVVLQNLGGRTVAIDKSKLKGGETYTQTLAPQIVGGAEAGGYFQVGGGGGGMGGAPRPAGAPAPSGAPSAVAPTGGAGAPQAAPTGPQPLIPIIPLQPKAPEAFMKASRQLNDLRGAIDDYKTELASGVWVVPKNIPIPFTDSGMPLPAGEDTARVAGKYNSLLMGVKNLYELGALTGPDMSIIERQLTNPSSWTGLLTSKNAMNAQVKVLEDMLDRADKNLSSSYKQPMPAAATTQKVFTYNPATGQLEQK